MTENAKRQVEMLRRDGYTDAANIIEQQDNTFSLSYMVNFAATNDSKDPLVREQLRALWTAYCLHADWSADTASYDSALFEIWGQMDEKEQTQGWKGFEDFDNFMCGLLV